jgi:hypothetical protein
MLFRRAEAIGRAKPWCICGRDGWWRNMWGPPTGLSLPPFAGIRGHRSRVGVACRLYADCSCGALHNLLSAENEREANSALQALSTVSVEQTERVFRPVRHCLPNVAKTDGRLQGLFLFIGAVFWSCGGCGSSGLEDTTEAEPPFAMVVVSGGAADVDGAECGAGDDGEAAVPGL